METLKWKYPLDTSFIIEVFSTHRQRFSACIPGGSRYGFVLGVSVESRPNGSLAYIDCFVTPRTVVRTSHHSSSSSSSVSHHVASWRKSLGQLAVDDAQVRLVVHRPVAEEGQLLGVLEGPLVGPPRRPDHQRADLDHPGLDGVVAARIVLVGWRSRPRPLQPSAKLCHGERLRRVVERPCGASSAVAVEVFPEEGRVASRCEVHGLEVRHVTPP
jgi:hypothetical protein